jgi:hypothetical protein
MAGKPVDHYDRHLDFVNGDIRIFYMEDLDILISERLHSDQRDVLRKVWIYTENLTIFINYLNIFKICVNFYF